MYRQMSIENPLAVPLQILAMAIREAACPQWLV
jgi:hypothetical protein